MDKAAYLKFIGLAKAPPVTPEGLVAIHRAQVESIAYENIFPYLGQEVKLGIEDLCDKILTKKRGGYCFELNTFFLHALEQFGFKARSALARVFIGRPNAGPRTHQVILVEFGQEIWLADVGFGGPGLLEAIPFRAGFESIQLGRNIQLRESPDWGMQYEEETENGWRVNYAIPKEKTEFIDIITGNHYCSTHPNSIFRQNFICSRPDPSGKITVLNRFLVKIRDGNRQETILNSPSDFLKAMDELKISISPEEARALHERLPPHPAV